MNPNDMKRAMLPSILEKLNQSGVITLKIHDDGNVWFRITEFNETPDIKEARQQWEYYKKYIKIDIPKEDIK